MQEVIELEFEIDYYTLSQYAEAHKRYTTLLNDWKGFCESLYEDISPRLTAMDCETGLAYTMGANTEMAALLIIDKKAKYKVLIQKEKRKAEAFQSGLLSLDPIEQEIIRIHYYGIDSKLRISVMDYNDILRSAQIKLCESLELNKANTLKRYKEREKQALRERVMASNRTHPKRETIRIG